MKAWSRGVGLCIPVAGIPARRVVLYACLFVRLNNPLFIY